jgi:TRAP transporter TAXI family solute receptor
MKRGSVCLAAGYPLKFERSRIALIFQEGKRMQRNRVLVCLVCLAALIFMAGRSDAVEYPRFLSIGGGTPGGSYFPVANGLAQLFSTRTPMQVGAQSTTGGGQNILLMAGGEIEMSIADNQIIQQAYKGIDAFEGKKNQNIRAICSIYPNYFQQLVRLESGIDSFADLAGKRMIVGGPASGTESITRAVYAVHGYDYIDRQDIVAEWLGTAAGQEMIQNRQADGLSFINFYPYSLIVEMTRAGDGKLISLEKTAIEELTKNDSPYRPGTIPAGSYAGQNEDIQTIYMQTVLIVNANLSDDLVYEMTRLIFENMDYLTMQNKAFSYMDVKECFQGLTIPLHPGAERYYREVGVLK